MDTSSFFDFYFDNSRVNSIIIMDVDGTVLKVSKGFTKNFGYTDQDLTGKNFSILFTASDKDKNKPLLELETVISSGQADDDNYIIDKGGEAVMCSGESVLVASKEGKNYVVKNIVNLQSKKQIQLFLNGTDELLERVFSSTKDIAMMVLDGSMKVQKVNRTFMRLFELSRNPEHASRLADIEHPFWDGAEVKNEIRKILVTNMPVVQKDFLLTTKSGETKTIRLDSKLIDRPTGMERKIFILIEDVTPDKPLPQN